MIDPARLTVAAALAGQLSLTDVRMDPAVLHRQADVAAADGNPQLAENLRRGAELAVIGDDEVLAMYDALRPHRSTAAELETIATDLQQRGASRCAALVREAAAVYHRRGLLR